MDVEPVDKYVDGIDEFKTKYNIVSDFDGNFKPNEKFFCNVYKTRILGVLYEKDNDVKFSRSNSGFAHSALYKVYKPSLFGLEKIVNFNKYDDIEKNTENPSLKKMGDLKFPAVAYSSVFDEINKVPVLVDFKHFIKHRTAVLGMTGMGKSNAIKLLIKNIFEISESAQSNIGQIIYDFNGEYANDNVQDRGSILGLVSCVPEVVEEIAVLKGKLRNYFELIEGKHFTIELTDGQIFFNIFLKEVKEDKDEELYAELNILFKDYLKTKNTHIKFQENETISITIGTDKIVRYSLEPKKNMKIALNNFYFCPDYGLVVIKEIIANNVLGRDNENINMLLSLKSIQDDPVKWLLWAVMLYRAGYRFNSNIPLKIKFKDDVFSFYEKDFKIIVDELNRYANIKTGDFSVYEKLYSKFNVVDDPYTSYDISLRFEIDSLINLILQRDAKEKSILGYSMLIPYKNFHTSERDEDDFREEIYNKLSSGSIVVLDLSILDENVGVIKYVSDELGKFIFRKNGEYFKHQKTPPNICIFLEEAHNIINKTDDLKTVWTKIAKEGTKYNIALLYSTQEPSSVHPNILSNTKNFIIAHLNNDKEIGIIEDYYFSDFSNAIKNADYVPGWVCFKSEASPYIIPVQIDDFKGVINKLTSDQIFKK